MKTLGLFLALAMLAGSASAVIVEMQHSHLNGSVNGLNWDRTPVAWSDGPGDPGDGVYGDAVYMNYFDQPGGYQAMQMNAGQWLVKVRARAGYGGDPGAINDGTADGGSASQTNTYFLYINDSYQVTLHPDWSTFVHVGDADNTVTMSATVNVSQGDYLYFRSSWIWAMSDYWDLPEGSFVPEPVSMLLLGLGGLLIRRKR